jgi:tripartite-type tricarboxylate transporter receptor subunit TctC
MAETFAQGASLPLHQIPYRSNPQALNDIIAGRVSMMFVDVSSARGFVDAGTLRAIAVTSLKRSSITPDLPTIDETAVKGFDLASFTGLFAPAGTPRAVVDKINAEVNAILARPDVVKQLAGLGCEPSAMSVDAFGVYIKDEVEKWVRLVKAAGIEPH